MNVILTGCMGFIGSNLISKLLNNGFNVIGFDNLENPSIDPTTRAKNSTFYRWENFKFYKIDINNYDGMKSILLAENKPIHGIIHLAARGSVPRSFLHPIETAYINEVGFVSICQLALDLKVDRLVFASSSSVYGDNKFFLKEEKSLGNPLSPYAVSKRSNEMFAECWLKQANIPYFGLRFFNVYGPGQIVNSAYSAVIPKFITMQNPIVHGDGTTIRDFTYVDDVTDGIILALKADRKLSGLINIGTGCPTSLNSLINFLGKADKKINSIERKSDIKTSVADTRLAKELIGFVAKTSIEDGLNKTSEYYNSIKDKNNG